MENHTSKYTKFREQYPEFIYHNVVIEEGETCLKISFQFSIPGLKEFCPRWIFPKPAHRKAADDPLLREMAFSLGMTELVSYWKITCSPKVKVLAGTLGDEQKAWWKDLYFNGLGEFFYVNGIREAEIENFMTIEAEAPEGEAGLKGEKPNAAEAEIPRHPGVLVPVGGGKDSAVTLELLKKAGAEIWAYIINPRGATLETVKAAGLSNDRVIQVSRTLDQNMLELNRQGYLNGHTPFSAIVAFSSLIAARLYDLPYIALSNESSANESTVSGSTVNHQYSKSFQFEQDFHRYAADYLPGSAYYFSLLRPLSEFQIARYFAGLKQYHQIFRSCNVGSKTDSWCGHCPKCLFVCLILSPFLKREEVKEIFGRDMLEDKELKDTLEKLTGIQEEKPFECVGSRSEVNTAIAITIQKLEEKGEKLPWLLEYYKTTDLYEQYRVHPDAYDTYFDQENLVPDEWLSLVKKTCAQR